MPLIPIGQHTKILWYGRILLPSIPKIYIYITKMSTILPPDPNLIRLMYKSFNEYLPRSNLVIGREKKKCFFKI